MLPNGDRKMEINYYTHNGGVYKIRNFKTIRNFKMPDCEICFKRYYIYYHITVI